MDEVRANSLKLPSSTPVYLSRSLCGPSQQMLICSLLLGPEKSNCAFWATS